MKTKICSRCIEKKELTEFYKSSNGKDGTHAKCKLCQKALDKTYHQKNRDRHLKRSKRNFEWSAEFIRRVKKKGCSKCSERRYWVLDFHHKDSGEKDKEVSALMNYNIDRLKKEIRKCIIVCANCHRDIHFKLRSCGATE